MPWAWSFPVPELSQTLAPAGLRGGPCPQDAEGRGVQPGPAGGVGDLWTAAFRYEHPRCLHARMTITAVGVRVVGQCKLSDETGASGECVSGPEDFPGPVSEFH